MNAPYQLKLTASEAALLDGRVGPEAQVVVTRAIEALSLAQLGESKAAMVAKILEVARSKGRLTFSQKPVRSCPCCARNDGYWPVARNTRYKVKGRPDFDKPKVFTAWDLDQGFVTVQHHVGVGFCATCRGEIEPILADRLRDIPCDTPAYWAAMPKRFTRWDNRKCKRCGWEGHEGQMRPLRTLMGDGYYQGGCPACPATNGFGHSDIEHAQGWVLVPVKRVATTPDDTREGSERSEQADQAQSPSPDAGPSEVSL